MSVMNMNNPGEPPMFVRAQLDNGLWYDIAIADISAMEVPQRAGHAVHLIIGGLHATIAANAYEIVHQAWVARRRSSAGR